MKLTLYLYFFAALFCSIFANEETNSIESIEDVDEKTVMKFLLAFGWEVDKLTPLAGLINTYSEIGNVSVVGWQDILDKDGKITEVRSVEVVFPAKPSKNDDDDDDEDSNDVNTIEVLNDLKGILAPFGEIGLPMKASHEEYNSIGGVDSAFYMSDDEMYIKDDGLTLYNETKVTNQKYVDKLLERVKVFRDADTPIAVLKFDVDGNLVEKDSIITPQVLGEMVENYEASYEMINEAVKAISLVAYKHPNEIPKHLALAMKEKFPEYIWHASKTADGYYMNRDVSVTVSPNSLKLDEDDDISYTVYGVKKDSL